MNSDKSEAKPIEYLFTVNKNDPIIYLEFYAPADGECIGIYKTKSNGTKTKISIKYTLNEMKKLYDNENNCTVDYDYKLDNNRRYVRLPSSIEEQIICTQLTELAFLEIFHISSCDGIYIPSIPDSLKKLKIGHYTFNHNLFKMMSDNNGDIYIDKCPHIHDDDENYDNFFQVNTLNEMYEILDDYNVPNERTNPNCTECDLRNKLYCNECFNYMVCSHENKNMELKLFVDVYDESVLSTNKTKEELKQMEVVCMNCRYPGYLNKLGYSNSNNFPENLTEQNIINMMSMINIGRV
jgi:hypothetical protein